MPAQPCDSPMASDEWRVVAHSALMVKHDASACLAATCHKNGPIISAQIEPWSRNLLGARVGRGEGVYLLRRR